MNEALNEGFVVRSSEQGGHYDLVPISLVRVSVMSFHFILYGRRLLLSVGFLVANAPDVLLPCGLLYYP